MISRYAAAARGGRNVAASGAVSTRGLKSAKSSTMRAAVRSKGPSNSAPPPKRQAGSMAGHEGGPSTYIQPNNSGYGNVKPKAVPAEMSLPEVGKLDAGYNRRFDNQTHSKSINRYNPFRSDTQLSKMIR